jgi:hypothetical protein
MPNRTHATAPVPCAESGSGLREALSHAEATDMAAHETRETAAEPAAGVTVPDVSVETSRSRGSTVSVPDLSAP